MIILILAIVAFFAATYFLLTGQAAFVRDTPMQILMAHVYERVVPLSELRADVPTDLETGDSKLEVVANGIPSLPIPITVVAGGALSVK